jgi:hypothetical protein
MTVPSIRFRLNISNGNRADTCGQTDMTKEIGAFCDYANASQIFVMERKNSAVLVYVYLNT